MKAASDVYAPVSGEVIEINEELEDSPELINESPFAEGWIAKIKLAEPSQLSQLQACDAYHAGIEE